MFDSDNIGLVVPLAFIAVVGIWMLAGLVRKYATARYELDFKRDLVERGLSVDEIERIVAAKSSCDHK